MNTRMDRYHTEESESRVGRNKNLYDQVNSSKDIDELNLTNNISIIDNQKLSEMLTSKNKSIFDDGFDEIELEDEDLENTKEYDLKKVIDEARKDSPSDYESTRFKKIRESEYEILNSLNLNTNEKGEPLKDDEETIIGLMKTVSLNEQKRASEKENNLMDDLMGGDNTEVLEPIKEEDTDTTLPKPTLIEELEKTKQLSKTDIQEAVTEIEETKTIREDKTDEEPTNEIPLANTFYTGNLSIKESDLDDFRDLQKELKSNNVLVKILIIIIVIIVLGVGVYLLNKYLNLGLF